VSWRKCLVRGLVFSVLACLAAVGWLYHRVTQPAAVKEQVIAQLESHFRGTHVSVDSAGLRLLGGISFTELRLIRQQGSEKTELLSVPAGILYHDKEQLLDGKIAIRKVELQRPRFHIVRNADGSWNVTDLLGPVDLSESIPTLVVRQGTILLEDRVATPDAAPVEINNVNLTLINDPRPTLTVQLEGTSELLGDLLARVVYRRDTSATSLTLDAPRIAVKPALVQRLGAYCAKFGEHARQLEGSAALRANIQYEPTAEQPWTHTVSCQLTQGALQHPQVPLALEQLEANVRCDDGRLRLERLTARAGAVRVEAEGSARTPRPDTDFEGTLKVRQLPVNADLFGRLPESLRRFQKDYAPVGTANLDIEVGRHGGQWRRHVVITTGDATARFAGFPYPLTQLRGRIEQEVDETNHGDVCRFDLVGLGSAARPVHVQGTVAGEGEKPALHVDIWGENIPLDEPLLAALPEKHQALARSFHPSGLGNFELHFRRAAGQEQFANHITICIHHAKARFDVFPYPLENVSGIVEFLPDHWEFRDFRGTHQGGEFRTSGRSHPIPGGRERVSIHIGGSNILIDGELEAALAPKLRTAWKALTPGGRMNLAAQIDQLPDRPEDIAVAVTTQGCTLRPTFFPYVLTDVIGTVRYARGKVEIERIAGRHGGTAFQLERGQILLKPAGGFWARLTGLRGQPIVFDADFQTALPPKLKNLCALFEPGTPVGLAAELVVDMPSEPNLPADIYWDGGLSVQDATLHAGVAVEHVQGQLWCQGRFDGRQLKGIKGNVLLDQAVLFRQPFREMHSHILVAPDAPEVLRLPDMKARFFGGDIGGEVRVEFGPTVHYDVNLTALQVKLEEFGRHNLGPQSQWQGLASARLYLAGHGNDIHGLEGHGSIDVPNGKMYNLPLLLDLIKMLGLRPPDRTAFEEAHAAFSIKGPRVTVERLDLDGNAISLSGQGQMNLDGTDLQLDFYAVWGRIKQWLPPVFRDIPPALGQQLLKIKMRGQMNDVKITKEPVPVLVEPVEKLLQRVSGRQAAERSRSEEK
jgi:hypothetical protein